MHIMKKKLFLGIFLDNGLRIAAAAVSERAGFGVVGVIDLAQQLADGFKLAGQPYRDDVALSSAVQQFIEGGTDGLHRLLVSHGIASGLDSTMF